MNIIRCEQCGLINWQIEEKCQHCGLPLPEERFFALAADRQREIARPVVFEHPRLSAGLWFAGAGSIPALLFVMVVGGPQSFSAAILALFVLLPALIAGVCGASLGTSILDQSLIWTPAQAAGRGVIVAAASFLFYILLVSIALSGGAAFFMLLIYGSIVIGWLIAIVGALAGWLLFKRRERCNRAR
jgi:hypothetical protein